MHSVADQRNIAVLTARTALAERAFSHPHNHERYLAPSCTNEDMASRENTPLLLDRADEEDEDVHRIELSFRTPPKNGTEFIFGWGAGCDVQIAERSNVPKGERNRTRRISQRHFSVGFDAQRRIVIRDTSVNGTVVSYDGQAQKERRMYFQWIILPGWKTIEISIPGAELAFQIQRAVHETWEAAFAANVDALSSTEIGRHDHALAHPMLQLGVGSRGTSVVTSGAVTPRREPIYLLREELGRGTFGRVYTVVDVSTGRQYAGKTFNSGKYEREVAILRSLKHVGHTFTLDLDLPLILSRSTLFRSLISA